MDSRFVVEGVDGHTHIEEAAPAILRVKAAPLFALEEAAAGGENMDAVHDMRVASRRLREAMRILAPYYAPKRYHSWYKKVRGVTKALGPVRDSDVFIDVFARTQRRLSEGGRRAAVYFIGTRTAQRARELQKMRRRLSGMELGSRQGSFYRIADAPRHTASAARSLNELAMAELEPRVDAVYEHLPAALDPEMVDEQHAMRIAWKRLRYAVEVFAPVYGDDFDELHATLTNFQDALGDVHDYHVFMDMLDDPERVADARCAGVARKDIAELTQLFEARLHRRFGEFSRLMRLWPEYAMHTAVLGPLEDKLAEGELSNGGSR